MTLFRHARIANMALTFEHRTIFCPAGLSRIRWSSSSRSTSRGETMLMRQKGYLPFISKVVLPLTGWATTLIRPWDSSDSSSTASSNPLLRMISMFSNARSSSAAVSSRGRGLRGGNEETNGQQSLLQSRTYPERTWITSESQSLLFVGVSQNCTSHQPHADQW